MLQRLRDYPRMAAIIVAGLYSKQPFVEKLTAGRFSFLLVAKPGDHKSLFQDVDGLRRGDLLDAIIPSTAANATSTSGSPVCR